jgi:hypothetical protein
MKTITLRSTCPRYEHSTEDRTLARSRRVMVAVLLVGSLLVACARVEATSLVAMVDRSNNRLIIAADCRVNRDSGSVSKCKIIIEPDCVAAIAGLYEEEATGFHLRELVPTACQEAGNLRTKAEAFLRISRKPYVNKQCGAFVTVNPPSLLRRSQTSQPRWFLRESKMGASRCSLEGW